MSGRDDGLTVEAAGSDAPASPVAVAAGGHTVLLEIASGIDGWLMRCHYDADDRTRPCWPHDEYGEPDDEGDCCTYVDWFENSHWSDVIDHAAAVVWQVDAVWTPGGGPSFTLAGPATPEEARHGE